MREKAFVDTNTEYRIKFRFIILTILLVVFYTSLLFSATIYIDPTYTASNQNGSISNPYSSWNQVTFINGNTYLQKRGTVFNTTGGITITGRNNITIGAYDTGSRPTIVSSGSGYILDLTTVSNFIIKDLEIYSTGNATSSILIDGYGTAISANNLIENCDLHDCEWGVRIISQAPGNRILNCIIHNTGDDGIYAKDITDIEIGYCNIYNVNLKYFINPDQSYSAGDNIQLVSLYDLYFNIHHNTLDHSSTGNKFCFIVAGETYTGLIEHNTMIGNSGAVTSCLYFGHTSGTVVVRYNTLQDGNYGIYSYVNDLQLYYNKIARNNQGVTVMTNHNLTAKNNVFYNNVNASISSISNTSVTSINNIFYLSGGSARAYNCSSIISSNYNNFNTQQSSFLNGHSTLASWQSASGNDMNSFIANPMFVNPTTGDFCLQPGSPCINTGTNVNLQFDYFGTQVPQQNIPDIGLHEYTSTQGGTNLPPSINNQIFQINENSANGTTVGNVVASDPNSGQVLTFSITGGNTNNAFSVNAASGAIIVANSQALNYEVTSSFPLTVRVTDNGSGFLWSQATVTVNLNNVNENPVISNQGFSVVQNASNGTIVGTVSASDPDQGQSLSFSITAGNTNNVFYINSTSGNITVANSTGLSAGSYNLTVRATDNGSPILWSAATVTITVNPAANQPPVIANQSFNVVQNSPNGTIVGTIVATDPNAGQILSYSIISGNSNTAFSINTTNGNLSVFNSAGMTNSTFLLTVRVTDNGNPSLYSQAVITINITQQINLAPVISNQIYSLNENTPYGTLIGTVVASDPNSGQTLSYTITAGNTNNAFAINLLTGSLTVNNPLILNYEYIQTFSLTVRVTDNGTGPLWSQASITINLININEPPVINESTFTIAQNAPNGTFVGTVSGADPDFGQSITYQIISGNNLGQFTINGSNGKITVVNTAALIPSTVILTVRGTDNGTPSLWSQAAISIVITQNGNQSPVISNQSFSIDENVPTGTLVGAVIASDPDQGQSVTYSIISGNTNNAFTLNQYTGNLSVNNSMVLNYEYIQSFALTIRATDNGPGSLWSEAIINVNVNNLNEAPIINECTFEINAFTPNGTLVGQISGRDPDIGQSITYQIISGNNSNLFSLNPTNGNLTVTNSAALSAGTIALVVRITDNGSPVLWSQAIVTVIIVQQGNQSPVIANQIFNANENLPFGTLIGGVVASDPDAGQTITYSITGGNTNYAFSINPSTGNVMVNNVMVLNYEYIQSFSLTVRVTDNGSGSLWSEAIITININNLNESPVLNESSFTIPEYASNGTFVGIVVGSDPDIGQSVTYQILSGNTSNAFNLNASNGALNVTNSQALNANTNPVFYLTVRIQDNGVPSLYSTGIIRVDVIRNKQEAALLDSEVNNNELTPSFIIYPNPSTNGIFKLKSDSFNGSADLQIFNTSGKLINNQTITSVSGTEIDLSDQADGIYILKVAIEHKSYSYKLIKN
jgi:hypothetical protein